MKKIPLTQGKFALVDDADYESLARFKWCACRYRNTYYAIRQAGQSTEKMHRQILNLKRGDGKLTDHKDMDGLNNQRNNLRVATRRESEGNQKKYRNNTSGYKGVYWNKLNRKWVAGITIDSETLYLGLYESKIDAARAYNKAAIKHFGEFANLNPIEGESSCEEPRSSISGNGARRKESSFFSSRNRR